jgi:hypothetical protein
VTLILINYTQDETESFVKLLPDLSTEMASGVWLSHGPSWNPGLLEASLTSLSHNTVNPSSEQVVKAGRQLYKPIKNIRKNRRPLLRQFCAADRNLIPRKDSKMTYSYALQKSNLIQKRISSNFRLIKLFFSRRQAAWRSCLNSRCAVLYCTTLSKLITTTLCLHSEKHLAVLHSARIN